MAPTPVFFPGKFHGQWSLLGYSPWDGQECDMTAHTHMHAHPRPGHRSSTLSAPWHLFFTQKCLESATNLLYH